MSRAAWALGLVLFALCGVTASMALFVGFPLDDLPVYFGARWFILDATSLLFVCVINLVFLGISVYLYAWAHDREQHVHHVRRRAALSMLFMLAMSLGVMSNHLLVLWALIEITTLCATPLVTLGYGTAPHRVAWRYLLYSSMSLGLTFLGFMCLTRSAHLAGLPIDFALDKLSGSLPAEMDLWLRLGLSFIMLGLGSKLGLAPLYGWLPETYETAPTSTSALLAAVQFNISVVAVFRILQAFQGHDTGFMSQQLLIMGGLSLIVAAIQVMAARNYKRLIAYACVSSSGVIAMGLSVGKAAAYGVVLYVVSNAFVKAMLFLAAGRMRAVYGTNDIAALSGVIKRLPFAGSIFALGVFALLGLPPFGSFMAEMLILSGIVQHDNMMAFSLMCAMLTIIFVATGRAVFPMLWGPLKSDLQAVNEPVVTMLPMMAFVAMLVLLGIYTPDVISRLLLVVAQSIGGS
ncbi:MAG: hypothetical protein IPG42_12380 [Betaproteobacteria bacterium]|jgi:hydrogenase-4 component F|nr:hypothetical protein [Betaproteobacteria bacterium]MBK7655460.1 hypothetical protein [Betaproteobacteria bacterium]